MLTRKQNEFNRDVGVRVRKLLEAKVLTTYEKRKLLTLLIKKAGHQARNDYYTYIKMIGDTVLPTSFVDGRHIKLVCNILQETVIDVETKAIHPTNPCISLPPGSSKSVLCSQGLPTWALGRNPSWFILAVGHSQDFMVDNSGRRAKDIMMSSKYRLLFPRTNIRDDVAAAGRFYTTENGMFVCAGWTTNIAGRRATLAILDDVVSEQTAQSDSEMRKIREWYGAGLESRLLSRAAVINLSTRWRPDDLIGFVLESDKKREKRNFLEVRFPAIVDKVASSILKIPEGESFWPELWPKEVFFRRKESVSPAKWQSLYLQNPVPEEGSYIKWDWCTRWEHKDAPPFEFVLMSLDTATTGNKGSDPTGLSIWGIYRRTFDGFMLEKKGESLQMFLLKGEERRMDFIEMLDTIDRYLEMYDVDVILIEDTPGSKMFIQELQRRSYPVIAVKPTGRGTALVSKVDRLLVSQPSFIHGRIVFPKTRWADDCISKLCQFPHGANDDFVDSVSMAVNWIQKNYNLHTGNEWDEEDDEDDNYSRPRTYWSLA